jgi:hypothetical protein
VPNIPGEELPGNAGIGAMQEPNTQTKARTFMAGTKALRDVGKRMNKIV